MEPNEIKLEGFDKLFEYEKHCRMIDDMDIDELKIFAKLYCKLYMKQQEVLSSLGTL